VLEGFRRAIHVKFIADWLWRPDYELELLLFRRNMEVPRLRRDHEPFADFRRRFQIGNEIRLRKNEGDRQFDAGQEAMLWNFFFVADAAAK
jgi:hypothetical protein